MPGSCKNHDLLQAHRRCFHCKEWICPKCTIKIFHHLFCSRKCIFLFKLLQFVTFFSSLFTSPGKALKPGWKKYFRSPYLERYTILLIFILNVILINILNDDKALLEDRIKNLRTEIETISEEQKELIIEKLSRINNVVVITGGLKNTVDEKTLDISGTGGKDQILCLYINSELRHTLISTDSKFSFKDVSLFPGENQIEIRSIGNAGSVEVIKKYIVKYTSPGLEIRSVNFTRGVRSKRQIALTFDGGASDDHAEKILDILANKKIKCTIFLTGRFIGKFPGLVKRMVNDGHEVGNHTYSHPHLTTYEINSRHDTRPEITYKGFQTELFRADSLFREVTGQNIHRLWRSPYGEQNKQIRMWAAEMGYIHVRWTTGDINGESMDAHDWVSDKNSRLYKTAEEIKSRLLLFGKDDPDGANGAIILMHLGSNRTEEYLYEALPEIIDVFHERDYKFCKVSELIESDER
ncbi:MAG: polysaccharide deacetylase family protein, partial [bacterium]|nr:polysaccharide deacetylase family protein [bacterium]